MFKAGYLEILNNTVIITEINLKKNKYFIKMGHNEHQV